LAAAYGAPPIDWETDSGGKIILQEKEYPLGDIVRTSLSLHQRKADRFVTLTLGHIWGNTIKSDLG
jgi:hypothetical protein